MHGSTPFPRKHDVAELEGAVVHSLGLAHLTLISGN
jgi:hypothetical protein